MEPPCLSRSISREPAKVGSRISSTATVHLNWKDDRRDDSCHTALGRSRPRTSMPAQSLSPKRQNNQHAKVGTLAVAQDFGPAR